MVTSATPSPTVPDKKTSGWLMLGLFVLAGIGLPALAAILARLLFE